MPNIPQKHANENGPQAKPEKHSRRYGQKPSYPIPVWNGILEHRKKIGPALWEFLWCLDKITVEDENDVGWLLGKTPIKVERIARDLKENERTVRRNIESL